MTKAHLEGIRSFLTEPDYSGPLGIQHAGLELLAEVDRLSTVEKERDGLRGHLRRIVDTAQYADFSATSERVFSELDVFLDEARKALETK